MTLDWITTPVAEDNPAGPDLWEADDPVFSEYYFDAVARLPEAGDYARIGLARGDGDKQPDTIFDPKSVMLGQETRQIDALIRRSRDLRLLTLRAQWSALAGDIDAATESVVAMADLLEQMPVAVHPVIDGAPRDRLEAINDLSAVGAMILPLRYLDIGGTGTTLRRMLVARGKFTPHDGEDDLSVDVMLAAMAKARDPVALTHKALTAFRAALNRIEIACLSHDTPHTPQIKSVALEIEAILDVIAEAQPELAQKPKTGTADAAVATSDSPQAQAPTQVATPVGSHDEARDRLLAVETYFRRFEPSSAAVLLVTQSRLLIGKSLVDVFDILMPEAASRAVVDFIAGSGFRLAHQQLRELANQIHVDGADQATNHGASVTIPENEAEPSAPSQSPEPQDDSGDGDETAPDADGTPHADRQQGEAPEAASSPKGSGGPKARPIAFQVLSAGDAAGHILAVETYFRTVEKSSPIPMLLSRARSYIGKDFESLLKELVPKLDY